MVAALLDELFNPNGSDVRCRLLKIPCVAGKLARRSANFARELDRAIARIALLPHLAQQV
jgi:hypothetical protein